MSNCRLIFFGSSLLCLCLIVIGAISSHFDGNSASASSCSVRVTEPSLQTIHSLLLDATEGMQFVVTTSATGCLSLEQPFVAIIEVRNSDGVTEHLGWQSGTFEGKEEFQLGISWVPRHGGTYQLRTFVVSALTNPIILSPVAESNIDIAESDAAIIVISYNPERTYPQTKFEPYMLKVIMGVNNTVRWINEDTAPHRIAGLDRGSEDAIIPVDFERPVFLYFGDWFEHTFTEEGLYAYHDPDFPYDSFDGLVRVFPNYVLDAYMDISITGLKDTYHFGTDKQIEYSLDLNGFETGCGELTVIVNKIDEPVTAGVYGYSIVFDCFGNYDFRNYSLHLPRDDSEKESHRIPISNSTDGWIRKPGTYEITASFQSDATSAIYTASREFRVQ